MRKIEAYTSRQDVAALEIVESNMPWADLLHISNVDGLDSVTTSISTTILPSADLSLISGEEVPARNIVLSVVPDPDWSTWTPEKLRRLVYAYFTPKSKVRLVFYTDELDPVEIYGTVETCAYNQFTPNPEYQISIVCPDPYFVAVEATTITGVVISPEDWPPSDPILIAGDISVGCLVKIADGYGTGELFIQSGDPSISTFHTIVDSETPNPTPNIFEMDSRPLKKRVRVYETATGLITNLLGKLQPGYEAVWPVLEPGSNLFAVMGDTTVGSFWELTYFEKYDGL